MLEVDQTKKIRCGEWGYGNRRKCVSMCVCSLLSFLVQLASSRKQARLNWAGFPSALKVKLRCVSEINQSSLRKWVTLFNFVQEQQTIGVIYYWSDQTLSCSRVIQGHMAWDAERIWHQRIQMKDSLHGGAECVYVCMSRGKRGWLKHI